VTILLARGAGDPDRVAQAMAIVRPSRLGEITDAVVAYTGTAGGAVYVERLDDLYRWSPATRGGPYPLMRLLARFLCCDQREITVGFVTVDDWCIVADPSAPRSPQYVILHNAPDDPRAVAEAIADVLCDE
jgi:hypothetical protein